MALHKLKKASRELIHEYNNNNNNGRMLSKEERDQVLRTLIVLKIDAVENKSNQDDAKSGFILPYVEPPFYVDYGCNISVGSNFYANFNCCFLNEIKIIGCGKIRV